MLADLDEGSTKTVDGLENVCVALGVAYCNIGGVLGHSRDVRANGRDHFNGMRSCGAFVGA